MYDEGMVATAVSYGTSVWLGELLEAGWTARVGERRQVGRYRLTLADDLEQVCREVAAPPQHGVVAEDGRGSRVFVPCVSHDAAVALLEDVLAEVDAE